MLFQIIFSYETGPYLNLKDPTLKDKLKIMIQNTLKFENFDLDEENKKLTLTIDSEKLSFIETNNWDSISFCEFYSLLKNLNDVFPFIICTFDKKTEYGRNPFAEVDFRFEITSIKSLNSW